MRRKCKKQLFNNIVRIFDFFDFPKSKSGGKCNPTNKKEKPY